MHGASFNLQNRTSTGTRGKLMGNYEIKSKCDVCSIYVCCEDNVSNQIIFKIAQFATSLSLT
jgi:hypothetical protein